MSQFALWMDVTGAFVALSLVVLLVVKLSEARPKAASRKIPERIDARLAEILGSASNTLHLPVRDEMKREAELAPEVEEHEAVTAQVEATLPEVVYEVEAEDVLREEEPVVFRHEEAPMAESFYRHEEPQAEAEPEAINREVLHSLRDKYAMYLREE